MRFLVEKYYEYEDKKRMVLDYLNELNKEELLKILLDFSGSEADKFKYDAPIEEFAEHMIEEYGSLENMSKKDLLFHFDQFELIEFIFDEYQVDQLPYIKIFAKHNPKNENKSNILKEAYGESDQLENFISLAQNKYRTFYSVTLTLGNGNSSNRYFAFREGALEYYNTILKYAEEDSNYYYNGSVVMNEFSTQLISEEINTTNFLDEVEEI